MVTELYYTGRCGIDWKCVLFSLFLKHLLFNQCEGFLSAAHNYTDLRVSGRCVATHFEKIVQFEKKSKCVKFWIILAQFVLFFFKVR